jgi:tripartite-type tricarboxylate transporter receptor subunit TctC
MRAFARWLVACATVLALLPCPVARAQDAYPSRAVTIVAPVAPGGVYSFFARIIGQKLEQRFGKSFIIENRPGAGTVIGAVSVAKAAPDGYTLLMAASTTLATNVTLHKQLPFDPVKDFEPVALIARVPEVLIVNATLPIRSIDDLARLAKAKPGTLSFASSGPGTALHLEGEALKRTLKIDIVHVPYKGATPAINDVAGGHVSMMFSPVSVARPLIQDGKVRALGVAERERMAVIPDVPTLAEAGLAGFDKSAWFLVVAPAGTPQPIVAMLHDAIADVMETPDLREAFKVQGVVAIKSPPPAELKRYIQSEIVYWGDVVRNAGVAGTQ